MLKKVAVLVSVFGLTVGAYAETVAQFNFDSMQGNIISDISGSGRDATFGVLPALTADSPFGVSGGKCLDPDDATPAGILLDPETADFTGGCTLEGWVKTLDGFAGGTLVDVNQRDASVGGEWHQEFTLGVRSDSEAAFMTYHSWCAPSIYERPESGFSVTLNPNQWYHLAFTYEPGESVYRFYVDGEQIWGGWLLNNMKNNSTLIQIGDGYFGAGANMLIDDVRISNHALSPEELGYHASFTTDVSYIPGDANGDGMVDVGDLGILAGNYGTASDATWAMGDFNNDGAVDVGDLGILAGNYGSSSAASVPEPVSLSLLGLGGLALLRRKR